MKIIQINIWYGKLMWPLVDFIREEKPDIVCMQEVISSDVDTYSLLFTLEEIKKLTGMKNSFMSPTLDYRFMHGKLSFGNAIITNLPISKTHEVFTNGAYVSDANDKTDDLLEPRVLQHAVLESKEGKTNILNTHGLYVEGTKNGNNKTLLQNQLIASYFKKLSGPTVLCADFNLKPTSPSMREFDFLRNLSTEGKLNCTYQPSLSNQTDVCDYIFVNSLVDASSFKMDDRVVSDHKALILEFDI